jgi:O-antigen ligase
MLSLKGILFFGLFVFCSIGALFAPYIGVYGYVADYSIGPAGQWWEAAFSPWGIRYSLVLALATAIGMLLNWHNLDYGDRFLVWQEKLLLLFLSMVWLSALIGPETTGRFSTVDHPTVKFSKVVIFALMLTHIITDQRKLSGLLWVFVLVALVLGLKAWATPWSAFQSGRLEGVGGADFNEANFFAAFMAAMLPIIGVQLLQSGWKGKLLCAVSGAFAANAVVLCRSRGAFLGVAAGVLAAALFAPKKHRKTIAVLLVLGIAGGFYLADEQFLERISTITTSEEKMDTSTASRLQLWGAGARMIIDHPLGVGVGNWYQTIGRYIPEYAGKDAHSTYIKCWAELGLQGMIVFSLVVLAAYLQLRTIKRYASLLPEPEADRMVQFSFGILISLVILLACGLTISLTYMEGLWILLMLPVCLRRALENALLEAEVEASGTVLANLGVRPAATDA